MEKKTIKLISICSSVILVFLVAFFASSHAIEENDTKHALEEEEQTFPITLSYDGIDKYGVTSSNTAKASLKSEYIEVEDTLKEGLEFQDVTVEKAKEKGNSDNLCEGYLVPQYQANGWYENGDKYYNEGVTYDKNTRKITYIVKDLEAGCMLNVNVKVKTSKIDAERVDIFHYAKAKEGNITSFSNKNHIYIGKEDLQEYQVKYEVEGEIPENVTIPEKESYTANQTVVLAERIKVNGYKFVGWTTNDAEIRNNEFKMPEGDVILKGVFQKDDVTPKYKVSYKVDGEVPDGFEVPATKEYYEKEKIQIDQLGVGTIIGEYKFSGWQTNDTELVDGFITVNKDVVITGSFEKQKYTLTYVFEDHIKPDNWDYILPEKELHYPGDKIELKEMANTGTYEFLGWNMEKTFEMPSHDITVVGRWQEPKQRYDLALSVEPTSQKQFLKENDEVIYKIEVKNTKYFPVQDVVIKEDKGFEIIPKEGYEVSSKHIATIPIIQPYESVYVYAKYTVPKEDKNRITNKVELLSAKTTDKRYTVNKVVAKTSNQVASKLTICNDVNKDTVESKFQYQITGIKTKYSSWVILKNKECKTIYLNPDEYKIKQIPVQEFKLTKVSGEIKKNESTFICEENRDYKVTFYNTLQKKIYYHSSGTLNRQVKGGQS